MIKLGYYIIKNTSTNQKLFTAIIKLKKFKVKTPLYADFIFWEKTFLVAYE